LGKKGIYLYELNYFTIDDRELRKPNQNGLACY